MCDNLATLAILVSCHTLSMETAKVKEEPQDIEDNTIEVEQIFIKQEEVDIYYDNGLEGTSHIPEVPIKQEIIISQSDDEYKKEINEEYDCSDYSCTEDGDEKVYFQTITITILI